MLYPVSAQTKPTMPRLGDADRVCFANRSIPALRYKSKYSQQKKQKIFAPSAFSFAYTGAKEKATKKENAEIEISRSAERDEDSVSSTSQAFKKA